MLEYYSVMEKSEILPFATTWIDLQDIMLSEIKQRKTNTVLFNLCGNYQIGRSSSKRFYGI